MFKNLQNATAHNDADAFVDQGFDDGNIFSENLLFLANIGVNAGKRLVKAQTGGIDSHGNFNWWKDLRGPYGGRVTRAHYDNHGVSSTRWTNNIAVTDHSNPESESHFLALGNHKFKEGLEVSNVVLSNNIYCHNDTTEGARSSYAFFIFDHDGDSNISWPKESEISNNSISGSGELKFVYWFRNGRDNSVPGPDQYGLHFVHENNRVDVRIANSKYRVKHTN